MCLSDVRYMRYYTHELKSENSCTIQIPVRYTSRARDAYESRVHVTTYTSHVKFSVVQQDEIDLKTTSPLSSIKLSMDESVQRFTS
jgi:hypothetical protein